MRNSHSPPTFDSSGSTIRQFIITAAPSLHLILSSRALSTLCESRRVQVHGKLTGFDFFCRNINTNAPLYEWIEALGGSAERFSSLWQLRFVINAYWHYPGGFDRSTYPDFALLRLSSGFQLNSRLSPIRLPRWSDANRSFHGSDVQLVGWGELGNSVQTTHLQVANFTINFNPTVCGLSNPISLPGFFFCMSRGVNNASAQLGDEGAPLIVREDDGQFTLLGTHSQFSVPNNRIFGINFSFFLNYISTIVPSLPIRP